MLPGFTERDWAEMRSYKDRLVTKEELVGNGARAKKELPDYMDDKLEALATVVCQGCNS